MSRKISYKGTLNMGTEDRISLATIKGKVGYKITKFQLMSTTPGQTDNEFVGQIFKKSQVGSIGPVVNMTDSELLAVVFYKNKASSTYAANTDTIIIDNEKFNQDIFVSIEDAGGGTTPCNYYIELETMDLSELETTYLTLQNLRTITSP